MEAMSVPRPAFELRMAGKNVTADLSPWVEGITYEDHEEGEADTVEIMLDNSDLRFIDAWYPTKGDTLALKIGYDGQPLLDCGLFEIDKISAGGPPDVVTLHGIAAGIKEPRRTRNAMAYEATSLKGIAEAVAKRAKLKLVGTVEAIPIRRVTQIHESDLEFLRRVADEYGYAFSVKGTQLVFFKRAELVAGASVLTIDRADIRPWSAEDTIMGVVGEAVVSYHDPKTKALKKATAKDPGRAVGGDTLKVNVRAETPEQAQAKARAASEAANREATQFDGTVYGNPAIVAGINVTLTGFGALSGNYHIHESTHSMGRSEGYKTQFKARKVEVGSG